MKTFFKKLIATPLLCLTLFTALVPPAQAEPFMDDVTIFCSIQAIGADGSIVTVIGTKRNCTPAWNVWCTPEMCDAITLPQQ